MSCKKTNHVTFLLSLILPRHSLTKKIATKNYNDVLKIWCKKGETFLLTLKYGGSSMMFWACFSSRGSGHLIAVKRNNEIL